MIWNKQHWKENFISFNISQKATFDQCPVLPGFATLSHLCNNDEVLFKNTNRFCHLFFHKFYFCTHSFISCITRNFNASWWINYWYGKLSISPNIWVFNNRVLEINPGKYEKLVKPNIVDLRRRKIQSSLRGHNGCFSWGLIPGEEKLLLISGTKSASLLDHISRFLSHQFVTWYLRSISKTQIVKLFCPCMSEHMIYIKNVTNVTQTLHQNVTNVTKQNIASKEILTIEFHTKYMKLFVNMLFVICVLLNTKFHNTSQNFYFEVIWNKTIVSCKVTNMTNHYMDFILDLDKEFNFQRSVCLDSNRKHYYQSKTCW